MGYAPNARILTPPVPADSGTSLSVESDTGDRFPTAPFTALIFPSNTIPTRGVDSEEVTVLTVDHDTLTFDRADDPISITSGLEVAALRTVDIYSMEEEITLAQEFPATDINVELHLRTPGGAVGTYMDALDETVTDGGSTYALTFEANESGKWTYSFNSDERAFPADDFFVRFSEVL